MFPRLTCDTCNLPIPSIEWALVEWEVSGQGATRFKIIHELTSSPLGRGGCAFHVYAGRDNPIEQLPALQFVDSEALQAALVGGVQDARGLLDTLQRLSDRQGRVDWAIDKLTALGASGAAALGEALAIGDHAERRAAALSLARLGRQALPATEALACSLTDADEIVRFRAAFALKVLGVGKYQKQADEVIDEVAPVMTAIDALEPFVATPTPTRGIITAETNLTGEAGTDVTGSVFLAPEEDYRGGGMGSIRLFGSLKDHGLVRVTAGVFDADIGIWADQTERL